MAGDDLPDRPAKTCDFRKYFIDHYPSTGDNGDLREESLPDHHATPGGWVWKSLRSGSSDASVDTVAESNIAMVKTDSDEVEEVEEEAKASSSQSRRRAQIKNDSDDEDEESRPTKKTSNRHLLTQFT